MRLAFPHPPGSGGPGSFQTRFEAELGRRGWSFQYASSALEPLPDAVFVVGGTRKLAWLHGMRRRGVPIIYRLDGLLWLHRARGIRVGIRRWLESEARNGLAQWIHGQLADRVVYQSEFVKHWWATQGWRIPRESDVIYNGVDLNEFRPTGCKPETRNLPDVVCVEGHLDYSPYAIEVLNLMGDYLQRVGARLIVHGGFNNPSNRGRLRPSVDYRGVIERSGVAGVYRGNLYLSLDVNPACPNAVAEALASGAPVIGFDTGAVKELVGDSAGEIVPFGGDPWRGDSPDFNRLPAAYEKVASDLGGYSERARERAERFLGVERMVDAYIEVVHRVLNR